MVIKKLTLRNFRNYVEESFSFCEGLNILTGKNAQGKTNCAEAVFYLCTGASLRIRHEKQLIRHGEECAEISAEAQSRFGTVTLGAKIYENKRELYVNGNKLSRAVDFLGNMNSVFFSPGGCGSFRTDPTNDADFWIFPFRRLPNAIAPRFRAIRKF